MFICWCNNMRFPFVCWCNSVEKITLLQLHYPLQGAHHFFPSGVNGLLCDRVTYLFWCVEILRRKEVRITEKAREKNQSSWWQKSGWRHRSVQGRVLWKKKKTWTGRNVRLDIVVIGLLSGQRVKVNSYKNINTGKCKNHNHTLVFLKTHTSWLKKQSIIRIQKFPKGQSTCLLF